MMPRRSPVAVLVLPFVTFGVAGLVWLVTTKQDINRCGGNVPTAWMLAIPGANIYWLWRFSKGVSTVTRDTWRPGRGFLVCWLLGPVGWAITQHRLNTVAAA